MTFDCTTAPHTKEQEELLRIIEYYGPEHQLLKLTEEFGEATQAIIKFMTSTLSDDMSELCIHLIEELEDVRILLDQLESYLGRDYNVRKYKIQRTLERIQKDKEAKNVKR